MSVVEFLTARLAEDEHTARQAVRRHFGVGEWAYGGNEVYVPGGGDQVAEMAEDEDGHHIALHDPERVLREVAAKRAILKFHEDWPVLVEGPMEYEEGLDPADLAYTSMRLSVRMKWMTEQQFIKQFGTDPPTTPMIRAMAQVYLHHPDFDPAWRVES